VAIESPSVPGTASKFNNKAPSIWAARFDAAPTGRNALMATPNDRLVTHRCLALQLACTRRPDINYGGTAGRELHAILARRCVHARCNSVPAAIDRPRLPPHPPSGETRPEVVQRGLLGGRFLEAGGPGRSPGGPAAGFALTHPADSSTKLGRCRLRNKERIQKQARLGGSQPIRPRPATCWRSPERASQFHVSPGGA